MNSPTPTTRFRFRLWLTRFIDLIVPCRLRAEWRQEPVAGLVRRWRLWGFCLAAVGIAIMPIIFQLDERLV